MTSDGSNSLSFVHALVLTLVGTLVVVVDATRRDATRCECGRAPITAHSAHRVARRPAALPWGRRGGSLSRRAARLDHSAAWVTIPPRSGSHLGRR